MNDIWTRLKEANPIEEVVAECGITLNGRGRTMKAVDHDSFVVDVAKQYYVWNAQGRGGSVIDFLVNERGMSLQDAGNGWRGGRGMSSTKTSTTRSWRPCAASNAMP